ncbi:MAG: MBL fold metallo-hydrolase [Phycisphaerae bacterium]|nr:MBL fold metallo-hydrolase [Phycisphaerae bacterium]MBM90512.1 MBL fold metallo-hydrolase [Phycisphaerae bacterium]
MLMRMIYDEKLAQAAYLIGCQQTGEAIIFDPERDVDRYIDLAATHGLQIIAAAETHIHADFVSGSRELAERIGAKVYVSDEGGEDWRYQWLDKKSGGGSYDHQLLKDGDSFRVGKIEFTALHTPGHTPEHMVYLVTDHGSGATEPIGMVSGDFVFVGDLGRPDLLETAAGQAGAMEPSARNLYNTLQRLEGIPDFVQVWPAHGAGSACGKALGAVPTSTIGYEKRFNPAILAGRDEQRFVDFILSGQPEPPLYFANMKRDNKIGPPVLGGLPTAKQMSPTELTTLDTRSVALLDVRDWDTYRAGHLPGAMSFEMGNSFNTDVGSMVRDTDDIYLIIDPDRLEECLRDLVRIGLDHIKGWCPANEFTQNPPEGLVTTGEISVDQAQTLIDAGKVRVVDVRRATEFSEGHIPNAVNIAHTRLASRMSEVPGNGPLLINCRSGKRSARASGYLQRAGYEVINLEGGYLAWEAAQAPSAS